MAATTGYAKLADFGFAKAVESVEEIARHSVVGTAEYFPPELAGVSEEEANSHGACCESSAAPLSLPVVKTDSTAQDMQCAVGLTESWRHSQITRAWTSGVLA